MEAELLTSKRFDRELVNLIPNQDDNITDLGEGLKVVRKGVENLDMELTEDLLTMQEFTPDRPLDDAHVLKLLTAMQRGTFLWEHVTIIVCTFEGKPYRMNGQHTCWARREMPKDYKAPVNVIRYTAKTENDMRRLYASIDRGKFRNNGNVIVSYLYDTPRWKGVSKRTIVKLSEGLVYWLYDTNHQRALHDTDERAYLLMTDYYNLARAVSGVLEGRTAETRHIKRRPVVGAMFATFKKNAARAVEFWESVRDGTNFGSKYDPRLTLRNWLCEVAMRKDIEINKNTVDSEKVYRACILAFNAFQRGDDLKVIRVPDGDRPQPL